MNLLHSRLLTDPSNDARAESAEKVTSNRAGSPSGGRAQNARTGKDASGPSPASEFQSLLDADDALSAAPSAKSTKKTAAESGPDAPLSLHVDPSLLAAALAQHRSAEPTPPLKASIPPSGSLPSAVPTDPTLAHASASADATTSPADASSANDGKGPTPLPPSPADVTPPDAQIAPIAAALAAKTLVALGASLSPQAPQGAAAAPSRGRAPVESARSASNSARVEAAPAAPRAMEAPAPSAKNASAPSTQTSSDGNPGDGSDPNAAGASVKPEAHVDSGAALPPGGTPSAPLDPRSASANPTSDRAAASRAQASSAASRSAANGANSATDASADSGAARGVTVIGAPASVNVLTSAKGVPPAERPMEPAAPSPATTAATSAMNQQVIRGAAHGVLDLPDLGRVQVSAKSQDGEVGVRVLADRPETATILLPHAAAMAAEARAPGGSSVRVHVESRNASTASHTGGSGGGGREAGRHGPTETSEGEESAELLPGADRPRVRIVL